MRLEWVEETRSQMGSRFPCFLQLTVHPGSLFCGSLHEVFDKRFGCPQRLDSVVLRTSCQGPDTPRRTLDDGHTVPTLPGARVKGPWRVRTDRCRQLDSLFSKSVKSR